MSSLIFDLMWRDRGVAAGMKSLGTAADQAGKKITDLSAKVDQTEARLTRFGTMTAKLGKGFDWVDKNSRSINTLSNGLLKVGTVAAVGVGIAVKKFADFDQAMSNVAATGSDARANMDALRKAAIDAGASTAFSATEAAGGIEALAKAGVSAKDTLGGGLKGALDLAAAGGLGVEDAAEAAASAMNQFGLKGQDVTHIADLLAQGAGTASGEVSDMAAALKQSGLVANQFGLSIDETTQALALFAKNGLVGSDSGTSFKTMLTSLYAPSGAAADTLKDLGISAYDATGALKPIGVVADDLKAKLDTLSAADRNKALKNIFGSDAIRAGTILLKDGSAGLAQMATEFGKFGSASDVAKTKMNNLTGDIENFKGALDSAFIGAGSGGNDFLRGLTQGATDLVNAFNDLPSGAQQATLKIGAFVAVAALAAGGLGKLAIAAAETRTALMTLGITATGVKAKLAALNGAGLIAVAGFVAVQAASAALDGQLDKNSAGIDGYKKSLAELGKSGAALDGQMASFGSSFALLGQGIDDTSSAFKALKDTQNPVSQGFRKIGDALGMSSTAGILAGEFDKLDKSLTQMDPAKAAVAFGKLSAQAKAAGFSTEEIAGIFDDYTAAQKAQTDAANQSGPANKNAAKGVQAAADAAREQADAMQAATDAMYDQANAAIALSGSQIGVEAAIDAARKSAKENGKTLDVNTEKGRANRQALNSLASATLEYTSSLVKSGASAGKVVAANERGRASFIATARAMGASKKEATQLANSLFTIPDNVKSQIVVAGAKVSKKEASDLNAALKGIPPEKRAKIVTIANTKGAKAAQDEIKKVKDKQARIRFEQNAKKKAAEANRESQQVRNRERMITIRNNAKKAREAADRETNKAKNRDRDINYDTNARETASRATRGAAQAKSPNRDIHYDSNAARAAASATASARRAQNVTRYIQYIKKGGKADGGYVDGLAGGGTVRGQGGPREDNIAGVDRATGQQTAWVSVGEFVTNEAQTKQNRVALETINAGGKWDLVPRLAAGGSTRFERPRTYERLVGARTAGAAVHVHNHYTVNAPNYIGTPRDLLKGLETLHKTGASDSLVKKHRTVQ